MEYAASLVKIKPNMKIYIRGPLYCMELTRDIKPPCSIQDKHKDDLNKILSKINNVSNIVITVENDRVVVYIKEFHFLDMINYIR